MSRRPFIIHFLDHNGLAQKVELRPKLSSPALAGEGDREAVGGATCDLRPGAQHYFDPRMCPFAALPFLTRHIGRLAFAAATAVATLALL